VAYAISIAAAVNAQVEPHEAILEAARSNRCDLIVMASHGHRPVSRFMLAARPRECSPKKRHPRAGLPPAGAGAGSSRHRLTRGGCRAGRNPSLTIRAPRISTW
jgi:hypothetical protein